MHAQPSQGGLVRCRGQNSVIADQATYWLLGRENFVPQSKVPNHGVTNINLVNWDIPIFSFIHRVNRRELLDSFYITIKPIRICMRRCVYAIDYGTTNSLIAGALDGEVMPPLKLNPEDAGGGQTLKSVIFADNQLGWSFGAEAVNNYTENPTAGRLFKSIKKFLPDESFEKTRVFHKEFYLHELIAKQLGFMKNCADQQLNMDVDHALFGHPARFAESDEGHNLALKRLETAARQVGFKHVEFCPEPVAAAYRFQHELTEEKKVLIVDLGGGTSDFTVLKMGKEKLKANDVLSLGGVSIAGDALDGALMKAEFLDLFGLNATYQLPMSENRLSLPTSFINKVCSPADLSLMLRTDTLRFLADFKRYCLSKSDVRKIEKFVYILEERLGYSIYREIEQVKISLSDSDSTSFEFEYPGINLRKDVAKPDFESAIHETASKILRCLDETVSASGLRLQDIDIVSLTGGTTGVPYIQSLLAERFESKLKESSRFASVVVGLAHKALDL